MPTTLLLDILNFSNSTHWSGVVVVVHWVFSGYYCIQYHQVTYRIIKIFRHLYKFFDTH